MQKRPPAWLLFAGWAPVAIYFFVKYVVIGYDRITSRQSWLLIGAVILAEVALWQYRKRTFPTQPDNDDGTDS